MMRSIVTEPTDILHKKAVPVKRMTGDMQRLIEAMIEMMYAAHGVGLAANQMGSPHAIFVASADVTKGEELVLINPVILKRTGKLRIPEGCLSLPGISSDVTRAANLVAEGLDRQGRKVRIEAEGLMARIIQHEVDHLEGHLFVERVGVFERRRLLRKYAALSSALRHVHV